MIRRALRRGHARQEQQAMRIAQARLQARYHDEFMHEFRVALAELRRRGHDDGRTEET